MSTLHELADLVEGIVVGDSNLPIYGVSTIQEGKPNTITFIAHDKYQKYASSTTASAIIVTDKALLNGKDGILLDSPQKAIAKVLNHFAPTYSQFEGRHQTAQIDSSAKLGNNVSIGPNTVIDQNVIIGDDTTIGANNVINSGVKIGTNSILDHNIHLFHNSVIGKQCIIHSGAVIGVDGFGFTTNDDIHIKMPHNGKVIIGNDVEIGANCTIDRGTIGDTTIGDFCKFDNGVQIAHNVSIGRGCLFAGHVTIAGSTKVGEFCMFGGQAGAIDHVNIGDRAILACYTAATKDLPGGKIYSGAPAREIKEKNRRDAVHLEVKYLKKRLKKIESQYLN